jgi:2-(1,2-epoxy-1,2-dihydrophenyl)acetyl-CoA isomerase
LAPRHGEPHIQGRTPVTASPDVSTQPVLLDKLDAGVVTLTLNRPERLNALNLALVEALSAAVGRAAADAGCRAVLITGAGRGFCAGADLSNRAFSPGDARPDLGQSLDKGLNPLIRAIRALPKPVVCAVNGPAAGAGANLALACDIVLAAKSAQFLQAFARIGLIPDAGGTFILPRLVGEARARALMMLTDPVGAEQAAAWGMIYRAVDDEVLMGEAQTLAGRLAAGPTHALGLIKRALFASPSNSLDAQLDLERDLQREAGAADEYREGVSAFLEKRPADFAGKRARA